MTSSVYLLVLFALLGWSGCFASASPYKANFADVCVASGKDFKQTLPCPATNKASCAYVIDMKVWSWDDWVFGTSAFFLVFPSGADFCKWNDGESEYNSALENALGVTTINQTIYVPAGQTYVLIAYNDKFISDMHLQGSIEFYPNTVSEQFSPFSVLNPKDSSAGDMVLYHASLFALGFVTATDDSAPTAPLNQECLKDMDVLETSIAHLHGNLSADAGHAVRQGELILGALGTLTSEFHKAATACEDKGSCPGFLQQFLLDALSMAGYIFPEVKIVEDVVHGFSLIYHGYDLVEELKAMEEATNYYDKGYAVGRMYRDLRAIFGDLRRRKDLDAQGLLGENVDLRHNDGTVRTLAQWQQLRSHTAA